MSNEPSPKARPDLEELRGRIDDIDRDILKSLQERLELSLQTRRMKTCVRDKDREKALLDRLKTWCVARPLLQPVFVSRMFRAVIRESLALQKSTGGLIGFQGEHGAYGEEAAIKYDSELIPIPCRQFDDVFQGVASGRLDCGIVPVQNSIGGSISRVNELLLETDLLVRGEVILPIRHCLLADPEADYRDIREVHSHPQALAQCRDFVARHGLIPRSSYDTAGAARKLALDRSRTAAAVAGHLCAELYHLQIIKRDIQDRVPNFTRFLIVSKAERSAGAGKCSLAFSVPHTPGALYGILQIFAGHHLNLTRIESVPDRDNPGQYTFFCDFQIAGKTDTLQEILDEVRAKTHRMKYLGCYKEDA